MVFTPDVADSGNIMHHIIRSLDRSELVVADVTGNNPNVLYELGVIDAMGKARVKVIIQDAGEKEKILPLFDGVQDRIYKINAYKTDEAIKILEPVIHGVIKAQEEGDFLENPLTNYFGVPLYTFSSAHGLAHSYYYNLVHPCIQGEIIEGPEFAKGKKDLKMECIIPNDLDNATRYKVETLVNEKIFIPVTIKALGRDVNIYIWSKEFGPADCPVIVDIPTTLASLKDNVIARLGRNVDPNPESDDYQEIQFDEISKFKRYLQRYVYLERSELAWQIKANFKMLDLENTKIPKWSERNKKNS